MKPFKFKLAAILRMREFKKQQIEVELGKIVQQINGVQEEIDDLERQRTDAYHIYEQRVRGMDLATYYQYAGDFLKAAAAKKTELLQHRQELQQAYQAKLRQMEKAMGDVKVMEKVKAKAWEIYRKKYFKAMDREQEDNMIMHYTDEKQI
ncbi:MAG: hypothetical protein J6Y94_02035 [Bacteriovoracaceae bacterium]|nr:hypothetical protein [Bacteriovoracaceae bacterium]